ncbi:hypothetical protein LTR86_004883 [Recurvomyces mirabilis]|nr:hypothetical protein LTR86_004883 [Recurvomyces mirabilis]
MTPVITGKSVPSLSVIKGILRRLIDLLNFRHKDLHQHYTSHESKRISVNLDQLASRGKLIRGRWRKKQWIGFKTIHKLSSTWIQRAIDEGTRSWDIVMLRLLGVLLQASCSSRSGDIARSHYYEGLECLCYKHLELKLKQRQGPLLNGVQNLTLTIALEFTKGHKSIRNDDKVVIVDPMTDENQSCVCLIAVLLVVALRLGRVRPHNLQGVLDRAAARHDGVVEWEAPDAPVLCRLPRGSSTSSYDIPATQHQILDTIREMGLAAGVLGNITTGDIRNGALRDTAYLDKRVAGVAGLDTAIVAGHTTTAYGKGLTQEYVGPIQQPIWNMRAENSFEDRLAPKIGQRPFMRSRKFKTTEIDEYMDAHDMDKSALNERMKAGFAMKKDAIEKWRKEQNDAMSLPSSITPPTIKKPLRQLSASDINTNAGGRKQKKKSSEGVQAATSAADNGVAYGGHAAQPPTELSMSKPPKRKLAASIGSANALSLDDIGGANVDAGELDFLCDLLDSGSSSGPTTTELAGLDADQDEDDEAVVQALGAELPAHDAQAPQRPGDAFVAKFSTINIFHLKRSFDTSDPEVVAQYVATGNSRDPPEPYLYYCSKCGFGSRWPDKVQIHESTCNKTAADATADRFCCHYEGCNKSFAKESVLKAHIANIHAFTVRACVQCPDQPDVMYKTYTELQKHRKKCHENLEIAMQCPYKEECGKAQDFTDKAAFKLHLRSVHHKTPVEIAVFVPRKKMVRSSKKKAVRSRQKKKKKTRNLDADEEEEEEEEEAEGGGGGGGDGGDG